MPRTGRPLLPVDEIAPEGNDASRVSPQLFHRHETDPLRIGGQLAPEQSVLRSPTATRVGSPASSPAVRKGTVAARN